MKTARILIVSISILLLWAAIASAGNAMSPEFMISNEDIDEYESQTVYNSIHREYFVVWHQYSGFQGRWVMGKRIDRWGKEIATYTIAFDDAPVKDNAQPTIAYDPINDRYLVAWIHDVDGNALNWDVMGRFVPWDGPTSSLNRFDICTFGSSQINPRAAYAGTQQEFLVTWWNEGSGGASSYVSAARVNPNNGSVLGTYVIATGTEERFTPDVAYNQERNEYLIVYQVMDSLGGNIGAVRMNAGGSILGGGEFLVAGWPDAELSPRVAASRIANQWMIVWASESGTPVNNDIYARRLWVDGWGAVQMSTPVSIDYSADFQEREPEVACHPESTVFGVSYQAEYPNGYYGICGRTLDTSDHQGQWQAVREAYLADTIDSSRPAMAASPEGFLVVWEQERQTSGYSDIPGRIMWQGFTDSFESGDFSRWDLVSP